MDDFSSSLPTYVHTYVHILVHAWIFDGKMSNKSTWIASQRPTKARYEKERFPRWKKRDYPGMTHEEDECVFGPWRFIPCGVWAREESPFMRESIECRWNYRFWMCKENRKLLTFHLIDGWLNHRRDLQTFCPLLVVWCLFSHTVTILKSPKQYSLWEMFKRNLKILEFTGITIAQEELFGELWRFLWIDTPWNNFWLVAELIRYSSKWAILCDISCLKVFFSARPYQWR